MSEESYLQGVIDGMEAGMRIIKNYLDAGLKLEDVNWDTLRDDIILTAIEVLTQEYPGEEELANDSID